MVVQVTQVPQEVQAGDTTEILHVVILALTYWARWVDSPPLSFQMV